MLVALLKQLAAVTAERDAMLADVPLMTMARNHWHRPATETDPALQPPQSKN